MRRKEYDDFEDVPYDALTVAGTMPDPLTWADGALALVLGGVAFALVSCFAYPCLDPAAWGPANVAAGLRPAESIMPGHWRLLAWGLYRFFGVSGATGLLPFLGHVALGAVGAVGYLAFRSYLAVIVRPREGNPFWSRLLARLIAVLATLAFVCADPVWRSGQAFGPVTLETLMLVLMVFFYVLFLKSGGLLSACLAMFLLGLTCSETFFGFLFLGVFWTLFFFLASKRDFGYLSLLHPFVKQVSKWYLTFLWGAGFCAGVALNLVGFAKMDGLAASGFGWGDVPYQYALQLWHGFTGAATIGGWIVGLGVVIVPTIISFALANRSTDEEYFLPFHIGGLFLTCGALAYSQLSSVAPLWFWTWIKKPPMVADGFFLVVAAVLCTLVLLSALAVFGVDAFCRDHKRLVVLVRVDSASAKRAIRVLASPTFVRALRIAGLAAFVALFAFGILPGRTSAAPRTMLGVVRDYVKETAAECGDASWLFADGAFDEMLELESACSGKRLRVLSMMSGQSPREVHVRRESLRDSEDRLSAAVGAPNLLRTWQRDKKDRLAHVALQLGFELWRRSGEATPPTSGLVSRPAGFPEDARRAGIAVAHDLAKRILAFYAAGGITAGVDPRIRDLFLFAQWRVARMARLRAEILDRQGDAAGALAENALSDKLDDSNASLKRILDGMARSRDMTLRQMTPREGLQFALVRADFNLARRYAEPILDADPDDANANFGMGMGYFELKQYGRAEEFLRRCLKRNGSEPAVWNNLAIIAMLRGNLREAREDALHALQLAPDSMEIRDTLKQVEEAAKKAGETNAPPAKAEK